MLNAFFSLAALMISEMANIPIRIGRMSNPASRAWKPKVKRGIPSIGAAPTIAKAKPMTPLTSPLTTEPLIKLAIIEIENTPTAKYS